MATDQRAVSEQARSFVATFTPTDPIPERDPLGAADGPAGLGRGRASTFRSDRKVTAGASFAGVRWAVVVTDEATGEETLKVPATEQPLVDLHRRLTKLARGDHHVVRLVADVRVRELSRTGKAGNRTGPERSGVGPALWYLLDGISDTFGGPREGIRDTSRLSQDYNYRNYLNHIAAKEAALVWLHYDNHNILCSTLHLRWWASWS
jgi:hypothetical protein